MIFYQTSEVKTLIISILIGFFVGLVWEFFRFLRHAGVNKNILVFFEDFIFALVFGVIVFLFTYCMNYLVIRWFEIIGIVLGFTLYLLTLGRLLTKFSQAIISAIVKIVRIFYNKILSPIYILLDKFIKSVKINIERIQSKKHERLILDLASKGFENKRKGI